VPPHDLYDRAVLEPVPVCPFLQGHALPEKCRPDPKNACPIDPSHVTCPRVVSKFRYPLDGVHDYVNSVKTKIHGHVIIINQVLERFRHACGFTSDRDVAKVFQISPSDLANRKKRGTLLPLILVEAIHRNVNANWILTGAGSQFLADKNSQPKSADPATPVPVIELLGRAKKVLTSGNTLAVDALSKNILYFSDAIEMEGQLNQMKTEIASLRTLVNDFLAKYEGKEEV
jgi:hypothetical protein